jgi:hypothetical protein
MPDRRLVDGRVSEPLSHIRPAACILRYPVASIFCDQSAVYVGIVTRLACAKFTPLPRSSSTSRTGESEHLFWAEFLFLHKLPCTETASIRPVPGNPSASAAPNFKTKNECVWVGADSAVNGHSWSVKVTNGRRAEGCSLYD